MAEQLKGMQDPRLEVAKTWRDKVTPTKDSDISGRVRTYQSLVDRAVFYQFAQEGATKDIPNGMRRHIILGTEQVNREVGELGFNREGFRLTVNSHMERIRRLAEEDGDDEYAESERQAMMGDVPARGIVYKNGNK